VEGWRVNTKRAERIWRREGLKVPRRQPKRGRLWLNDGLCVRRRPYWPRQVWVYDFVQDRTHGGRRFRMLTVIDEYTRECRAIVVARQLTLHNVLQALSELFVEDGPPDHVRSDSGPEFVAKVVFGWPGGLGVTTLVIEPGSPWENGRNDSFNGKLRGELLGLGIFYSLRETNVLIERWRRRYNTIRPHSSLGYRPPAPVAVLPWQSDAVSAHVPRDPSPMRRKPSALNGWPGHHDACRRFLDHAMCRRGHARRRDETVARRLVCRGLAAAIVPAAPRRKQPPVHRRMGFDREGAWRSRHACPHDRIGSGSTVRA
jgi:transposase InsO family protein